MWSLYWSAVTLIVKLLIPMPIGVICALLILWKIVRAGAARSALIRTVPSTNNVFESRGASGGAGRVAGGVSRNTLAMLLLSTIYFCISLPNIIVYAFISMANFSCTLGFAALLAGDLVVPLCRLTIFTRIFDGLIFLVITEFRAALFKVLRCV